jgi:GNAT superfamily N-acetyltransferase
MLETRLLRAGDEAKLFAFLRRHVDSSLFLLSNVQKAGLDDHGRRLEVPALLGSPGIVCRPPSADDWSGMLIDWRIEYEVEAIGEKRTSALRDRTRAALQDRASLGWVLCVDDQPVSYSTFNASAEGVVQVAGVFTPREWRNRGYARAVVAGSLLDARREGAARSVLFTSRTNVAAQRAYASLGYEPVGDFGLMLFEDG